MCEGDTGNQPGSSTNKLKGVNNNVIIYSILL